MSLVEKDLQPRPGLRARKRQETRRRIADAGICLFVDKGVDATTLDEIAALAGISRRTFFHYFKSKDDILLSLQQDMGEMIAEQVRKAGDDAASPLEAIRGAVIATCAEIPADDLVAIDRLMRSSPAVQARKQVSYVEYERTLYVALQERWPDPARAIGLRLVALLAIGAIRLATDALGQDGERRTLIELLEDAFDALIDEISDAGNRARMA